MRLEFCGIEQVVYLLVLKNPRFHFNLAFLFHCMFNDYV